MDRYRLSKKLHLSALVVAIELPEFAIVGVGYAMGLLGGGWWWLMFPILPAVLIPWGRRKPRGYFTHVMCTAGINHITGYPLLVTTEFYD